MSLPEMLLIVISDVSVRVINDGDIKGSAVLGLGGAPDEGE